MNLLPPERNVEIKARVESEEAFKKKIEIAKKLTSSQGEIIIQKDTFFHSKIGRLKLRYLDEDKAQLVQYNRPDVIGPRLSKFNRIEVDHPEKLEEILKLSNGILGVLKKTRLLFLYNNTRIHLDRVDDLGNFMEFEVKLDVQQTEDDGEKVIKELIELFEIKNEDLMACSYFDELQRNISLSLD